MKVSSYLPTCTPKAWTVDGVWHSGDNNKFDDLGESLIFLNTLITFLAYFLIQTSLSSLLGVASR